MKKLRLHILFDQDGKWLGNKDRTITCDGESITIDEYAEKHGITLPDAKDTKKSKKQVNIDIEEKADADMGQPLASGHTEIDGTGDSEVSE